MENEIIIRQMEGHEIPEVKYLAKHSFKGLERFFIGDPLNAIVAVKNDIIIGGAIVKVYDFKTDIVGHIDTTFVVPEYREKGIGRALYKKTIEFLLKNNCTIVAAIVKDDNYASWQLFMDLGLSRCGLIEATKKIGLKTMSKIYFATPMVFASGTDLFISVKDLELKNKSENTIPNILAFLIFNFILVTANFVKAPHDILWFFYAYFLILYVDVFAGFLGTLISKRKWKFKFNSCGGGISLLISAFGGIYPMVGNWYPVEYDKTKTLKRTLALIEVFKLLTLAAVTYMANILSFYHVLFYCSALIGSLLLLYKVLPFYPFDGFGARRIYMWNKFVYSILLIISILLYAFTVILW